jgi:predicted DNA-binding protein
MEGVMADTSIRVRNETRDLLRRLAEKRGISIGELVDRLARGAEVEDFYQQANEAYAALRADPEASAEFDREVAAWDVTLADGLPE